MSTPAVRVEDNPDDAVEVAYFMGYADGRAAERGRAKREWVGLTDAEIKAQRWLLSGVKEYEQYTGREQLSVDGFEEFARAIEAALKEKNHD